MRHTLYILLLACVAFGAVSCAGLRPEADWSVVRSGMSRAEIETAVGKPEIVYYGEGRCVCLYSGKRMGAWVHYLNDYAEYVKQFPYVGYGGSHTPSTMLIFGPRESQWGLVQ